MNTKYYYQQGIRDGYRVGMKTFAPPAPRMALKTAYQIAAALKSDMLFADQLDSAIRGLRNLTQWMKDGTATKDNLAQITNAVDTLQANAPEGISSPLVKRLTAIYTQLKKAEAAWPKEEGGARNPNFFQLKAGTQSKIGEMVYGALQDGGEVAREIRAEAQAMAELVKEKARLYADLTDLEPIIKGLKDTLNPQPGQPLERVEVNVIRDVVTRLNNLLSNPNLPPQFVAPLNSILDGLKPKTEGGGWLGTIILGKLYEWFNTNRGEIENALRQIVEQYGRIMKSVKQRKA